ncbi:MAG: hypothetical protein JO040_06410 [Gemmatimonadetes bacterium]|nr:hypothetical protein [Gemmatimonadota bacterium]
MAENQNPGENMQIEPLSDDELDQVAGGTDADSISVDADSSSSGPVCCSCRDCS